MNSRRLRLKAVSAKKHRKFNFFTESELPGSVPGMQLKNIDGASEAVSAENRKERANEMDKIAGVRRN